jgi:hypothetical protein
MAHYTVLAGNAPVSVGVGDAGATFTNNGTGPLYYGYDEDITDTTAAIGTIGAGSSAALFGNVYLYVPRGGSRADVEVASLPVVGLCVSSAGGWRGSLPSSTTASRPCSRTGSSGAPTAVAWTKSTPATSPSTASSRWAGPTGVRSPSASSKS